MAARTVIANQVVSAVGGQQMVFQNVDSVNGNQTPNTGRVALFVQTLVGGGITVTVASQPCVHGRTGDQTVVIPANRITTLGPFQDPTIWGDAKGTLFVDYSALTGGTANNLIAAVQQV